MKEPLDSWQLRAFATLANKGSFTQAARELHLTQSAISHSMKALERNVGCRLFDRVGKKISLTHAGEQLLQHASKILREMEAARGTLAQLGRWGRGKLRIGATGTACRHMLSSVLREFREGFPEHLLTIEVGDTPELIHLLIDRKIDLALCVKPSQEPQLECHHLFSDELHFLVGAMHPWAQSGQVPRVEIPRQRCILYGRNSITSRLVEDYFRDEDMVLNILMELGDLQAAIELVKLGIGISIMAPWVARKELQEGSLCALPLGRKKLHRSWGVLHWQGKRLSLPEETSITLCRSAAEAL